MGLPKPSAQTCRCEQGAEQPQKRLSDGDATALAGTHLQGQRRGAHPLMPPAGIVIHIRGITKTSRWDMLFVGRVVQMRSKESEYGQHWLYYYSCNSL